jgi:hypothetical protein
MAESLIHAYGLFWKEDDVHWGKGSQRGQLLGVPAAGRSQEPVDFRGQAGIYVLYADYDLVYVGQAGSGRARLFARLRGHRRDHLANRWNRFSWFGTRRVLTQGRLAKATTRHHPTLSSVLHQLEAVLIAAAEPPLNRKGGNFGSNAARYLQVRDDRLGLTDKQMLRDLCRANGIDWKA